MKNLYEMQKENEEYDKIRQEKQDFIEAETYIINLQTKCNRINKTELRALNYITGLMNERHKQLNKLEVKRKLKRD